MRVGLRDDMFSTTMQRRRAFHLGQAPLSFRRFEEIGRLLRVRRDPSTS